MGEYDELKKREALYSITPDELYRRFRDVETLNENPSGPWPEAPIVRQVAENTKHIGRLDVRVNVILSGLAAGVLAYAGIITKGIVGSWWPW